MTTTIPSAALVPTALMFTNAERLALAGFLAAYSGLTRQAYELDLRQYASWCQQHHLRLFGARRADIENFARDLEDRGRARATVTRRLCTIAGFYRYAVEEELLGHSPAAHVRRPRLDYESHATGLDRNELGALLVAAGVGPPGEHALISLLALNGLRVSEATGADIEALGVERGHRTLVVTRKGGKVVTVPLAPRTARAIDLCKPAIVPPGGWRTGRADNLAARARLRPPRPVTESMQHTHHEPPIWRQATLVGMAFRATPEWVICIQLPASAPPGSRYTPCRSTPLLPPHLPSRPADQRLIPGLIRRGRGYGTAAALVLTIGPGQEFLIA